MPPIQSPEIGGRWAEAEAKGTAVFSLTSWHKSKSNELGKQVKMAESDGDFEGLKDGKPFIKYCE
jgi:hypothetical protein